MSEPPIRPSELKNKDKRAKLYQKLKLEKAKRKSERRKQLAKEEAKNPELKEVRNNKRSPNDHLQISDLAFILETIKRKCTEND